MNQKLALVMFFGGLGTFLTSLSEFFSSHQTWASMSAPAEMAHIVFMTATFCMTIAGALGVKLPRDKNERVDDKVPAENIVVSLIKEEKSDAK